MQHLPIALTRKYNVKLIFLSKTPACTLLLAVCLAGGARAQVFFTSSYTSNTIEIFDTDGNSTVVSGAYLNRPSGMALDSSGDLYIANYNGNNIVKIDTNGAESTFASSSSGLSNPYALAFDTSSNLYAANYGNSLIKKFDPHGNSTTFASTGVSQPTGLAFDAQSNLYVSNFGNKTIEKFDPLGHGTLFATNTSNNLYGPFGLVFDKQTNLYVANYMGGTIEKFNPAGNGTVFASSLISPTGLFFDSATNLYVLSFTADGITEINPAGQRSTFANTNAGLFGPLFFAAQPGFASPPGFLTIHQSGNNIVLNWGTAVSFGLESSTTPNGTYTLIPNATDPYTNAITTSNLFFRTVPLN